MILTKNAEKLMLDRYCMDGESPQESFERVARHGAKDDAQYEKMLESLTSFKFLPSRMPYMGTEKSFCSSCFVIGPIEDDTQSILSNLNNAIMVQRYGGGTGYNFSDLRPEGDEVKGTRGKASGPVSFMSLYNEAMKVFLRAGNKMGAQMAVLNIDHPDVEKFITCKQDEGNLSTFNISVAVTNDFMKALERNEKWDLRFNNEVYKTVEARYLWNLICQNAWQNGEPGIIFIDTVNQHNLFPEPIYAPNACSEQFIPYNCSCNLGSINVSKFVVNGKFDTKSYMDYVELAVDFLNNSLDNAWWPLQELKDNTLKYRNVGLGIMGFADALILMRIPYNSEEALIFAENLMRITTTTATKHSDLMGYDNTTLTSIAPTGSISMIANCSSSIEPVFNLAYNKNTTIGTMYEVNSAFEEVAKDEGFYSEDLIARISEKGTAQGIIPLEFEHLFKTANEIDPQFHVKMQAAFQKFTDNGISKTVNLPNDATQQDVSDVFEIAYNLGCKSITVYRDGSRQFQAIDTKIDEHSEEKWQLYLDENCKSGTCSL